MSSAWVVAVVEGVNISQASRLDIIHLCALSLAHTWKYSSIHFRFEMFTVVTPCHRFSCNRNQLQKYRSGHPVYTRSADGFSLHRSGVVSRSGANLKWTKSLMTQSILASEVYYSMASFLDYLLTIVHLYAKWCALTSSWFSLFACARCLGCNESSCWSRKREKG